MVNWMGVRLVKLIRIGFEKQGGWSTRKNRQNGSSCGKEMGVRFGGVPDFSSSGVGWLVVGRTGRGPKSRVVANEKCDFQIESIDRTWQLNCVI